MQYWIVHCLSLVAVVANVDFGSNGTIMIPPADVPGCFVCLMTIGYIMVLLMILNKECIAKVYVFLI